MGISIIFLHHLRLTIQFKHLIRIQSSEPMLPTQQRALRNSLFFMRLRKLARYREAAIVAE
jgi:hypothetical protein